MTAVGIHIVGVVGAGDVWVEVLEEGEGFSESREFVVDREGTYGSYLPDNYHITCHRQPEPTKSFQRNY